MCVLCHFRLLTLGGVTSISITLLYKEDSDFGPSALSSLKFTGTGASAYLMSLWDYYTKTVKISIIFSSKPASPLTSVILFKVLPCIQDPSSNVLSHLLCVLSPLLSYKERCSVLSLPLLHIQIHISLVQLIPTPLVQLSNGLLLGPPSPVGPYTIPVQRAEPSSQSTAPAKPLAKPLKILQMCSVVDTVGFLSNILPCYQSITCINYAHVTLCPAPTDDRFVQVDDSNLLLHVTHFWSIR